MNGGVTDEPRAKLPRDCNATTMPQIAPVATSNTQSCAGEITASTTPDTTNAIRASVHRMSATTTIAARIGADSDDANAGGMNAKGGQVRERVVMRHRAIGRPLLREVIGWKLTGRAPGLFERATRLSPVRD